MAHGWRYECVGVRLSKWLAVGVMTVSALWAAAVRADEASPDVLHLAEALLEQANFHGGVRIARSMAPPRRSSG